MVKQAAQQQEQDILPAAVAMVVLGNTARSLEVMGHKWEALVQAMVQREDMVPQTQDTDHLVMDKALLMDKVHHLATDQVHHLDMEQPLVDMVAPATVVVAHIRIHMLRCGLAFRLTFAM